jgi:hypothetical protein
VRKPVYLVGTLHKMELVWVVSGVEVEVPAGLDSFGFVYLVGSVQYKRRFDEPAGRCLVQAAAYNLCSGLPWVRQVAVEPVPPVAQASAGQAELLVAVLA